LTVAQTQAEIPAPPAGFSSREIAEHIIGELKSAKDSGQLQGFAIDVEVRRGEVWLKGQVSNPEQEQLAVDIARRTQGVKKVINALKVANSQSESQPQIGSDEPARGVQHALEQRVLTSASTSTTEDSASDTSDSDAIAREVLSRLQEQKRQGSLRNFGIDVQVDKQTVWLSGYVSSKEQEQLVLDVARYTPGVGQVVNDLTITGAGNHSASATTETVLGTPIGQLANPAPAAAPQAPAAPMQAWAPNAYYPAAAYGMAPGMMQPQHQTPLAFAPARPVNHLQMAQGGQPQPISMGAGSGVGIAPARFDHPQMPGYAWPSYAAYPNYAGVTYPQQYSASAWPYIGPFYPYPQVPLGWRRVTLEWDDGWWHLKFKNKRLH
jgi:osmotically-inducible protein OsmY